MEKLNTIILDMNELFSTFTVAEVIETYNDIIEIKDELLSCKSDFKPELKNILSPNINATLSFPINSSPITNACAKPFGTCCTAYSKRQPI